MVLTLLTADGPLTADAFGIDNHMAWNSGAPNGKPHSHAHDAKNVVEADDFAMERGETDVDNSSGSRPVRRTRSSPTRSSSPNMDRDDLAGLSAKHHAKDFFTCCLKVDFAENIDIISSSVPGCLRDHDKDDIPSSRVHGVHPLLPDSLRGDADVRANGDGSQHSVRVGNYAQLGADSRGPKNVQVEGDKSGRHDRKTWRRHYSKSSECGVGKMAANTQREMGAARDASKLYSMEAPEDCGEVDE